MGFFKMPTWKRICLELRDLIYIPLIEHNKLPHEIHAILFKRDEARCYSKMFVSESLARKASDAAQSSIILCTSFWTVVK